MVWSPEKNINQHFSFIHQQMYLLRSQREKRANLVTWKAKAWMQGGVILLEKVTILNKVYGCSSVCKRGTFKWHVSLYIFQETIELLIKCRRKQSLRLYVKIDSSLPKQNNILISSLFSLYFVQQYDISKLVKVHLWIFNSNEIYLKKWLMFWKAWWLSSN